MVHGKEDTELIRLHDCKIRGLAPIEKEGDKKDLEKQKQKVKKKRSGDSTFIDADGPSLSKPCYKVVTCDKNDDIVDLQASLMVGIARSSCE